MTAISVPETTRKLMAQAFAMLNEFQHRQPKTAEQMQREVNAAIGHTDCYEQALALGKVISHYRRVQKGR